MANPDNIKIAFAGVALSGRLTSLTYLYANTPSEWASLPYVEQLRMAPDSQFDDWTEVPWVYGADINQRLSCVRVLGYSRLDLYDNDRDKQIAKAADGFVIVVDSQRERTEGNVEELQRLGDLMKSAGRDLHEVPLVFQANKQDTPSASTVEFLAHRGLPGARWVASVATTGHGVVDAVADLLAQLER